MDPVVSVVMPVWNGEKYLVAAVDSILAQTFTDFELIVVDDGSTDDTAKILKSYDDPRLRIEGLDHAGIVVALNHGLAKARGNWIARQDADDISSPQRFAKQWQALNAQPQAVLSHTDVEYIGENSQAAGRARFPRSRSFTALRLCYQCPIAHSTVMFNKAAAVAAGGYLPEERHAEDFSLWGRLLTRGEFIGLPERLLQFRLHAQSVSQQNLTAQIALAKKIAIRHCGEFLRLSPLHAKRAHTILAAAPGERSSRDWFWFLFRCAPRLRWWSLESCAWLLLQTWKTTFTSSPVTKREA